MTVSNPAPTQAPQDGSTVMMETAILEQLLTSGTDLLVGLSTQGSLNEQAQRFHERMQAALQALALAKYQAKFPPKPVRVGAA